MGGSKLNSWGYAGFSLRFHLPRHFFHIPYLSHQQVLSGAVSADVQILGASLAPSNFEAEADCTRRDYCCLDSRAKAALGGGEAGAWTQDMS